MPTAPIAPSTIWPWPPMLNRPARAGTTTASAPSRSGAVRISVSPMPVGVAERRVPHRPQRLDRVGALAARKAAKMSTAQPSATVQRDARPASDPIVTAARAPPVPARRRRRRRRGRRVRGPAIDGLVADDRRRVRRSCGGLLVVRSLEHQPADLLAVGAVGVDDPGDLRRRGARRSGRRPSAARRGPRTPSARRRRRPAVRAAAAGSRAPRRRRGHGSGRRRRAA